MIQVVVAYVDLTEPCYIQTLYLLYKYLLAYQQLKSPHVAEEFPAFVETCMSSAVFTRPHTLPLPALRLKDLVHILFSIHSSISPLTLRYSSILILILLFLHPRELHFNQS